MDQGQPLGGINDFASAVNAIPTLFSFFAILFAIMQGVLALESADPCRISIRKMNILLSIEFLELAVLLVSEILSFNELRKAINNSELQRLNWIPPCLLAAGLLESFVDLYFTLAIITKSRVRWIPISSIGSNGSRWEIFPFLITTTLSIILVGWRLRWWWTGDSVSEDQALMTIENEITLSTGVMGFAVGWAVGISALVFIIIALSDLAEEGPSYISGFRYLWKPDRWIDDQRGDIKVWYRRMYDDAIVQEYIAASVLNADLELADSKARVFQNLERYPLHVGNTIVGRDQQYIDEEEKGAGRLHILLLVAEHLIVLPLLIVLVVLVARVNDGLDQKTFEVLRQFTDSVIVIAFLEIAIGVKNLIWSTSGTLQKERVPFSDSDRLARLHLFAEESNHSRRDAKGEETMKEK